MVSLLVRTVDVLSASNFLLGVNSIVVELGNSFAAGFRGARVPIDGV